MSAKDDQVYLNHILECIDLLKDYTQAGRESFMGNPLVQDAVIRRLQIMAESSQRLSAEVKSLAPEIDWRALAGFRNILVHDYLGGIDLEQVWRDIEAYLPELESSVRRILSFS